MKNDSINISIKKSNQGENIFDSLRPKKPKPYNPESQNRTPIPNRHRKPQYVDSLVAMNSTGKDYR